MSKSHFQFQCRTRDVADGSSGKSATALLDYQGKGFGIAEVSHRGKEFEAVNDEAIARCKKLLGLGRYSRCPVPAGRGDAAVSR